jgi:hypothetical protein
VSGRRLAALVAVWTLPALAMLAIAHATIVTYRIDVPPRLTDDARTVIAARLRAALEGTAAAPLPASPELRRRLPGRGPVSVQVWAAGMMRGRVDGYGDDLAAAVEHAASLLRSNPSLGSLDAAQRASARLKVDVTVGRGALDSGFPLLDMVTLHPGVDGVGAAVDGAEHLLLPDELVALRALARQKPFPQLPDVALGLDTAKVAEVLARRAGLSGKGPQLAAGWAARRPRYFRFQTDAFVEPPFTDRAGRAPIQLLRGVPVDAPAPTAANLRAAALAGARYLVEHLGRDGRYVYEVELASGGSKGGYSIPRHAGTTYFLAEALRISGEDWLREPVQRAFAHLQELIDASGCKGTLPDGEAYACVADKGAKTADLGSAALAVVALVEYQRATGEQTYEPMARALAAWILSMQHETGRFMHYFDLASRTPDRDKHVLYYTGEGALAMARMFEITGEPRYATSAERALDWLVDWYDFFAGGFVYFEEHWTCIAAEAAFAATKKRKYLEFCNGYAAFLRDQQARPGDFPGQPDLAGSYNVTPFVMPFNTPAGSRTEATLSTYQLGLHHGRPEPEILRQIQDALAYTLRQQVRPDGAFAVAPRARGDGAVPASPVDRSVRIDYVQHVCSAMIRASELVE